MEKDDNYCEICAGAKATQKSVNDWNICDECAGYMEAQHQSENKGD